MSTTFWFDPSCPFTWRTSRWIRDTAARRGETVRWRFLSLAILNEGRDGVPERFRTAHAAALRALRVLAAADEQHGQEAVDALYTQLGARVHDRDEPLSSETIAAAVAAAGLPAGLSAAADDTAHDKAVRESHDDAQARVGTESGSPVLAVGDGPAFFGPVLVPVPQGADADRLLDALRLLSQVPQFSELKRGRNPL
ncbi:DsbA family protein [Dactylosporangium sp. AC04546]|uniref:mycothiol-dependent nitroreductase Rv2466c family protein n=1 Tax=Dactylosporangium sp. AC04546 TaxID=2862460 RepID=UPI001EE02512|nr:DsbA family protein [Dactylosporangium sp. AC04546]WVK79085.1 DsbA family protein [Dactylosporangium sp. AC04546]